MTITKKRLASSSAGSHRRNTLVVGLAVILFLGAGIAFWFHRRSLVNFVEAPGPRFTGTYAPAERANTGELTIVSWNIRFGENVDAAIKELRSVENLQDADLLLLQEMDQEGVDQIGRALGYNYVYYPASIHTNGRLFGNAVLSKWPIKESMKIVLPHASPTNQQRRIAVRAIVTVAGSEITAYSVHTETAVLSSAKRDEQVEHLSREIGLDGHECVIVGGDFNTISASSIRTLTERMKVLDLAPVTDQPQPTTKRGFLGFTLDHLFVRDLTPKEVGVWPETVASDHFPLWAVVSGCGQE
ncbi:MAG: endonuclease/exonuclease/phosphatase family protein [Anaerolineae bacterium]